jgi:phage tail tape-measure protein
MSEETMMALVQQALDRDGIQDEVTAVGEFYPRGHTGGLFAGIMIGGDVGEAFGGVGKAVGLAVGSLAGMEAADSAVRAPREDARWDFRQGDLRPPVEVEEQGAEDLVFNMARDKTEVKVHKRLNVRVVELVDEASGARVELEGNRVR